MGALIRVAAVAALAIASPAHADEVWRWRAHIVEASARFGIPTSWIERVMRAESAGRTMLDGKPIRSRAGAMGLMQLMPATWADMRGEHGLGTDPDDPRDNILAGTAYLRAMYDRFGYPGLFGAYNAGPKRYADHLVTGARLPSETVAYISGIAPTAEHAESRGATAPRNRLFVVRSSPSTSDSLRPPVTIDALFAIRYDAR
jgi:soluble lytic murein transglycosylase-like protein